MRTGEELRFEAATVVWHVPPHPDEPCDCPTALCGLTVPRPGCEPHRTAMATLVMSIHPEHRCPGPRRAVNPDCPRIAHESGVVLGCQIDHGPGEDHGTVTGVMWTDDDERVAYASLDPHHRVARFRADGEAGSPATPPEGRSTVHGVGG